MSIFIPVFFSLIVAIDGRPNCSTYNPCGRNGYCEDNVDDEWTCECKFWWNGTLCNELTNSGKQVIALGCLLGFLMIIFYGLQIFRCIKNRRQTSNETKKKEVTKDSGLIDHALKRAKRKVNLSSFLVICLVITVAAVTLIIKWSLIKSIHNELVDKFLTNQPLYYVQNSFCDVIKLQSFNVITFPVACCLILIVIIKTKRASLLPNVCYGYGAPPIPIDFLSHVDRKFAAVIFAVVADELLNIMQSILDGSASKGEGIIITYLLRIRDVLIMGFRYYALLVAVYLNSILTLLCATIYAWLDYSITIFNQGKCETDFYPTFNEYKENLTNIVNMFDYYGTNSNLIVIQLCTNIPRFLCLSYISVKLPMLLIRKISRKFKKNISIEERLLLTLTREQRLFFRISQPNSIEMLYVKNLFHSINHRPQSQTLFARIIPKRIYEWRDDFRFSTRIVCVYSSIFLLLYFVTIQACIQVLPILSSIRKNLQTNVDLIASISLSSSSDNEEINSNTSNFPLPNLVRPYLFALFLTLTIIVIQLLILLVNIRRNLFQSFRGDASEIPRRQISNNVSYATGNFHFAGYFIGYLIWGFIIIAVFAVILCVCIDAFITYGSVRLIETILKLIIPSLLFVLFKLYLNKILAQYVFLQHYGEVLSLNNRRLLMIYIYFNFFLDAFLGFISSIVRLIKSVAGGIVYMCRLDYSPLGRKLETLDGGFSAYCGFIHTECAHRHPVLLVFVSHLYTKIKMRELIMINSHDLSMEEKDSIKLKLPSKYVRKWKLAVFLARNPTFVFFRKAFLNQLHIEEIQVLNAMDNDNIQRKLPVYTRRMSTTQSNFVADNKF